MLTNDQSFDLIKRWRDLDRKAKDLDFQRSLWAQEARAGWPNTDNGTDAFLTWCTDIVGMSADVAREMCARADAAKIVPDESTWKRVGGFYQISKLSEIESPKERVAVLEAAKATGRSIQSIGRERGALKPKFERSNAYKDAFALAEFLASCGVAIPPRLAAVVRRYVVEKKKAA